MSPGSHRRIPRRPLARSCRNHCCTKSKIEHSPLLACIYSTLTCYLCFVRTIYPKDVVVSCWLIVACCIHAFAALVERCVNTWAWKPVLSQLLIPLVGVAKSQPYYHILPLPCMTFMIPRSFPPFAP